MARIPIAERYWRHVDIREKDDCWEWQGNLNRHGYARFRNDDGSTRMAHRVSWVLTNGPIPEGFQVNHLCENRACVNPHHLALATPRENTLYSDTPARRNARKTHCLRGHEFTEANTYRGKKGHRGCRVCRAHRSGRKWALDPNVSTPPPPHVPLADTHCSRGHEWTKENTYWSSNRPLHRQCRACKRERRRRA